jgi:hypothetical protein
MRDGHRTRRSRAPASLEQRAFEWQPESCAINCLPPWLSTRARSSTAEDTCVFDAEHGKREEQNTWSRILRRFTVKPILFALPRTNKFGLEN